MTAKEKLIDIIETMVEYNMLDLKRAMFDKEYLIERVSMYIQAANIARESMNMKKIEL